MVPLSSIMGAVAYHRVDRLTSCKAGTKKSESVTLSTMIGMSKGAMGRGWGPDIPFARAPFEDRHEVP